MRVITAPEKYQKLNSEEYCIFLGGGITGCDDWQSEVIEHIKTIPEVKMVDDRLVIFNPRRKDFPMDDPDAAYEQIMWEHRYIAFSHLITLYFAPDEIQPICLFELGKSIHRPIDQLLITSDPNYPRLKDIDIQTMCTFGVPMVNIGNPYDHAQSIVEAALAHRLSEGGIYHKYSY